MFIDLMHFLAVSYNLINLILSSKELEQRRDKFNRLKGGLGYQVFLA